MVNVLCRAHVFLLTLTLSLSACSGHTLAPVSEHSTGIRSPESEYRKVLVGDTLYSIAWESGRDYRELAEWNAIQPPFTIKVGQNLRLFPPTKSANNRTATTNPVPPRSVKTPATTTAKTQATPKTPTQPSHASTTKKPAPKQTVWIWPAEGSILSRYTAFGSNKGIDIGGRKGQPIKAAAAGQVVYQGSGLRGYGKLIIVKHDADFLSAYAHCDKVFVAEGSMLKRGQKIAEMGNSGTDQVKLHFEIRYRGAPVDPQDYLPRK